MGISWSGRRRSNYYQNQPPHPPPPPPPPQYFHSSSSSSSANYYSPDSPPLLSPPPPPPPPPPPTAPAPPHAYVYANTSVPYPAPHNHYATHPPPLAHTHYYSGCGYGAPNYGNSAMGRFGYPPYYANQASSMWPPFRPPMVHHHQPMTLPPPYVEHQNAKKVRNDVNVHKDMLRIEVDEQSPNQHLLSSVFEYAV